MSRRPNTRQVKCELFIKCGKVCMYDMQKYDKEKLVLHHDPPFRKTQHTISSDTHIELHKLELDDRDEYNRRMETIRENKKILELRRLERNL